MQFTMGLFVFVQEAFFAFSKTCEVQNVTLVYNFSVRIRRKKENEIINRNINNKGQLLQRYF